MAAGVAHESVTVGRRWQRHTLPLGTHLRHGQHGGPGGLAVPKIHWPPPGGHCKMGWSQYVLQSHPFAV